MTISTSITDQPIQEKEQERLGIDNYAGAMADFIDGCATPLTIGIQGEWGSGKTSLMYMIKEDMDAKAIATSWVNTWEFSMFRTTAEIVPGVMRGMLESLQDEFETQTQPWPAELSENMEKVKSVLKGIAKFAVDVGVRQVTGESNATNRVAGEKKPESRAEIAQIKGDISQIMDVLVKTRSNKYKKVVFFIDDLDRLEPAVAVSILESLKNIFDIKNCVFVLAIDYDVVVKGLTSKFGEKTDANDREFRSFFDKIIQVPFSMPVSAYDVNRLIAARFEELGFKVDHGFREAYQRVASATVGGNPRSIKRYINTYSLLRRIRDMQMSVVDGDEFEATPKDDFTLFALIGIQIAYPKIYNLILKDSDFPNWDDAFAQKMDVTIDVPEEYKSNNLFDEKWEQFLWSFCMKDPYLKVRALSVIETLNVIREQVGDDAEVGNAVIGALQIANITSVDDDTEANEKKFKKTHFDGWETYRSEQKARGVPSETLDGLKQLHDQIVAAFGADKLQVNYTPSELSFSPLVNKRKGKVMLYARATKSDGMRLTLTANNRVMKPGAIVDFEELRTDLERGYKRMKR